MKYLVRLLLYIMIFGLTFSVTCVAVLRFVPVTVTPVKIGKFFEHFDKTAAVRSNWRSIDKISEPMRRAVIATEDGKFFEHNGFDFDEIRKALDDIRTGRRERGASTISQQTAKNVFCGNSGRWLRKGVEAYYTVLIEALWGKERILEVYLNVIETHPGVYGAQATAKKFYDNDALQINEYEAAMIATVLPNPARMNIGTPSSYMSRRASRVRQMMRSVEKVDFQKPE